MMKIQDHRLMHQLVCSKGSRLGLILTGALMMIACGLFTATPAEVTQPTSATDTSAEPTSTPSPTATAQPLPTATIQPSLTGLIFDQTTQQPLAGVEVKVGSYTAVTDAEGRYALVDVPAGQYVLSAVHDNYDPGLSYIFTVVAGRPLSLDVALYPAETTPYPQDPMLTHPIDPSGAPTTEEAERLARLQGLTGDVTNVKETKLSGQFLVNYKIDNEIRAAVAELRHEAWVLTDETRQEWQIIKVCGNLARWLEPDTIIPTPQPQQLPSLGEVVVDELSVRTCTAETCPEVEVVERGTQIEILGCWENDGWCQVGLPSGEKGWVPGQSLQHLALAEAVPRVEAGGGRIAFLSDRDREPGLADIYLMNPDGSDLVRITSGLKLASVLANSLANMEDRFAWSATHKEFFYATGGGELYAINADGNGETFIAQEVYYFDLSPDGRHIAFGTEGITVTGTVHSVTDQGTTVTETEIRRNDIAVMNIDGTAKTILTDETTSEGLELEPNHGFYGPAWSPDGSKIVFNAAGSLAIMNADGTDPFRLTPLWSVMEPFSWSPDGRYIAFCSPERSGVDFVDIQDKGMAKFIEDGLGPAWSPDGSKITFYKDGPAGIPPNGPAPQPDINQGEWQIWIMNTDGSGLTQLTFEGHNCCPVWVH